MSRILLVEDHDRLAQLMCKALAAAGIAVDVMDRIDTAWTAMRQLPYQAVILDRGLPDGDGLSLLQRVRGAGLHLPCLVLTARDALHDRIEGLEAGADDYLPKPFAMDELVARVRALLRRPADVRPLAPSHDDLMLRPDAGLLCCADESVTLAPAEMQIMRSAMPAAQCSQAACTASAPTGKNSGRSTGSKSCTRKFSVTPRARSSA